MSPTRTAGVGATNRCFDECSQGEFGLVACGDLIARGLLALGLIATVEKFGWELYGAIGCPLSDSGLASLGLFALFSDFGSVFAIVSITGSYELAELIFV